MNIDKRLREFLPVDLMSALDKQNADWDSETYLHQSIDVAIQYCKERHPKMNASFIVGSYACNNHRIGSDIDLYVIYNEPGFSFREQLILDGNLLQSCIISKDAIIGIIYNDARSGMMNVIESFLNVSHIAGQRETTDFIYQTALDLYRAGPPKLASKRLERQRLAVINNLYKLMRTSDDADSMGCSIKLLRSLIELLQISKDFWIYDEFLAGKNRNIREEYEQIMASFRGFCRGEKEPFYECVKGMISKDGAPNWSTKDVGILPLI